MELLRLVCVTLAYAGLQSQPKESSCSMKLPAQRVGPKPQSDGVNGLEQPLCPILRNLWKWWQLGWGTGQGS